MNIIQSFWSKPYEINGERKQSYGGWCNPAFFYMSWALSCLSLRRFYNDVELYTDKAGKELLIDKLKLPYTKVYVVLDELNNYSENLWAIGKIFSYSLQKTPFIHVDGDIYIWKPFPKAITKANLVAQHLEDSYPYNVEIIKDTLSKLVYLPNAVLSSPNRTKEVNAGILGGHDIAFFQSYTREAFDFVNNNIECISSLKNPGMFNTIFEQFLFYNISELCAKKITYAFDDIDARFKRFGEFELVPENYYIHSLAFYKKMFGIGEAIAYHLYRISPSHYKNIIGFIK